MFASPPGSLVPGIFNPVPQVFRSDAQVELMFLLKAPTSYFNPVHDPWFEATKLYIELEQINNNELVKTYQYSAQTPVGVVGCATQWTWCNPTSSASPHGQCLGPTDLGLSFNQMESLQLNSKQSTVVKRLKQAMDNNVLANVVEAVGSQELLASRSVVAADSVGLPADQWVRELNHLFGISIVGLQFQVSRFPRGNGYPTSGENLAPVESDAHWMCTNQIIQRDDFTSFKMAGVIAILVLGGLFILVDIVLHPLLRFLAKTLQRSRSGKVSFRAENWRYSSIYHGQAYAFRALGQGTWKTSHAIPTTGSDELSAPLWTNFNNEELDDHSKMDLETQSSANSKSEQTGIENV